MSLPIPPAGTPAHEAMLSQGEGRYLGVDIWEQPSCGLPAGKILVQFDYRDSSAIEIASFTASKFFTDADTLLRYLDDKGQVHARHFAQALQVSPFRRGPLDYHWYSSNVAIYELTRELRVEQLAISQSAEFGQGKTRNNIHLGDGVATQYFVGLSKEALKGGEGGADPVLKLKVVLRCIERDHRLDWLQPLDTSRADNLAVEQEIARVFEDKVNKLLAGTDEQKEHGRQIAALYKRNQDLKKIS